MCRTDKRAGKLLPQRCNTKTGIMDITYLQEKEGFNIEEKILQYMTKEIPTIVYFYVVQVSSISDSVESGPRFALDTEHFF